MIQQRTDAPTLFLALVMLTALAAPALGWDPYGRDTVRESKAPSLFGEFMAPEPKPKPSFFEVIQEAPEVGNGSVAEGDAFFVLPQSEPEFEDAGAALGEAYSTTGGEQDHGASGVYD